MTQLHSNLSWLLIQASVINIIGLQPQKQYLEKGEFKIACQ